MPPVVLPPSFRTRVAPVELRRVESCIVLMLPGDIVERIDESVRTVVSVADGRVLLGVVVGVCAEAAPALIVRAMAAPMAREVVKRRVIPLILHVVL
jgi:hypothetical protein